MAKIIVNYSKGRREYLAHLYEYANRHGAFGLSSTIDNKEQALFLAALGMDNPVELSSKKDEGGWFRTESVTKYAKDVAMMSSFLLGTATSDSDVDRYTDLDEYMNYVEKCAEGGFGVIEKKLEDANGDNELLERKMLKELDLLYTVNVENDI